MYLLGYMYSNYLFLKTHYLVSLDASFLVTNIPFDKAIELFINRCLTNNWFNTTHDLNLNKTDLVDLLSVATKKQLFQFNGALYKQTDGVAIGIPRQSLISQCVHVQLRRKR